MNNIQLLICFLLSVMIMGCDSKSNGKVPSELSPQTMNHALILGVYHFNNPGKDTYNLKIDDYFSEIRQEEIQELVDLLAVYEPTKIFVEFLPEQQHKLDSLFGLYINDQLSLKDINGGRNEVYQIGFRLAKQLGIKEVIAADHQGAYLAPYVDFIADTLSLSSYQAYNATYKNQMEERQERFNRSTVRENLVFLNNWQQILDNHNYYNNIAIKVKDTADIMFTYQEKAMDFDGLPYQMRSFDFNNIGVDMAAEWYKRNLFIYRNILEHTGENDKALIIFGSGHVRHLVGFFSDHPNFITVDPNSFLKVKQ
ncbi:DUF5694 domain-containing protein [Lutimonas sp.]|uniref:DUF5694 domain-containing protein n=1 Tax=Lutimonas sp. TaxID=1872403 RepID=UPI003D9AD71D